MEHTGLRVALCGNIANNAFNMTRILRERGCFAQLVDDGRDLFPFARPIWEARNLELSFAEVMEHPWQAEEWRRLEAQAGWEPGDLIAEPPRGSALTRWIRRVADGGQANRRLSAACAAGRLSPAAATRLRRYRRTCLDTIIWMEGFDVVIAFGFHAAVAAFFADRPTIYVTYGGDIRVQLKDPQERDPVLAEVFAFLLDSDRFVIDAYGCDLEIHEALQAKGINRNVAYACLPNVNTELLRQPRDGTRIRREFGWPEDGLLFFMASRVDERWKRSSLFIDAFAAFAAEHPPATLVVTGWGADFDATRSRLASDPALAKRVLLLEECYSKPRLFDLYAAADVIVDQFAVGSLGSVSFEALCMGKPVLTYLAPFNLLSYPVPPPVLNARTRRDILQRLRECARDPHLLPDAGRRGADWYRLVYSEDNLLRAVNGLSRLGPAAWKDYATAGARTLPAAPIPVPDHAATVTIQPWPSSCRAGLALLNAGAPGSMAELDAALTWLARDDAGTRLPVSLSLPVRPVRVGAPGYFPEDGEATPTPWAGQLASLVRSGAIQAFDGYGGTGGDGPDNRPEGNRVAAWLERLAADGAVPPVWANRWNGPSAFDLAGSWDDPAQAVNRKGAQAHGDLLVRSGVRFFCLAGHRTDRIGLGPIGNKPDGPDPVKARGGNAIVVSDRLADGTLIRGIRHHGPGVAEDFLPRLLERGGGAVVRGPIFGDWLRSPSAPPPRWLEAAATLAHSGSLWVRPLGVFLRYCELVGSLRLALEGSAEDGIVLRLYRHTGALDEADLAGVHLRLEGTFVLLAVERLSADGRWEPCRGHHLQRENAGSALLSWPEHLMAG